MTTCPEGGHEFDPHTHKGPPRRFCTPAHKRKFFNLMAKRGAVLTPLVLIWRSGKHKKSDASIYALAQMAALADKWRAEDKIAGRDATFLVERKRKGGWVAADLA
jgi:hypothetical protein